MLPSPQRDLRNIEEKKKVISILETDEPTRYKPSDLFRFEPKPDITVSELAEIFKLCIITLHHNIFENLTSNLRRHFKHVTMKK